MNLLRVSFAAASYKTLLRNGFVSLNVNTYNIMIIRGFATGNLESEKVVKEMSRRGDCVVFNTLICEMCKSEGLNRAAQLLDHMRREKASCTYETYKVLNETFVNGFSPSVVTLNDVFRGFLRIGEMGDSVNYNTLITDMSKADELSHAVQLLDHMWRVKGLSPNEITYTSLIHSLCKHDRIDEAYKVLSEMIVSGFYLSVDTANDVLRGFLRIGEIGKANEMRYKIDEHFFFQSWMDTGTYTSLLQSLADEVTYTNLMNAYFDEGKCYNANDLLCEMKELDKLHCGRPHCDLLSDSVIYSVFINGLDNKVRTRETKKDLMRAIYDYKLCLHMPTFEYRLVENCSDDKFKSLVELVEGFCNRGLENAYDTMLKWNYKPNGIVYNLFIIEHCKLNNIDQAYNMYKEMVHYGFACHIFTVFALIGTLYPRCYPYRAGMVDELLWVIQSVLRSCNLNDSEVLKFLNEFNPNKPNSEALFDVLAEKAKDGLFLKCSYAPASA